MATDPKLLAHWAKTTDRLQTDRAVVQARLDEFDEFLANNELGLAEDVIASLLTTEDRTT